MTVLYDFLIGAAVGFSGFEYIVDGQRWALVAFILAVAICAGPGGPSRHAA